MISWLIPANVKFYEVFEAFKQGETYWPMNAKIAVGDQLYIYLATPYKQLGFVCDVGEIGIDLAKILPIVAPFIKGEIDSAPSDKPFMKLTGTRSIAIEKTSAVSLDRLREHGLNGMLMGARKLDNNPQLFDYIKEVLA